MPPYSPVIMKKCVHSFIVSQINMFTLVVHDLAWSWIGLRSVLHQFLPKMCYCMGRVFLCVSRMSQIPKIGHTLLGISQVHRNTPRYTNIILFQMLITSDDGTSGKINTFTHQVTIQTSPLRQAQMAFTVCPDFCSA